MAFASGATLWLTGRVLAGYVPLPSSRALAWAAALAALGFFSAAASPSPGYAAAPWRWMLGGVALLVSVSAVSRDEREAIDQILRAAAWVILLLACYQRFFQGIERPPASLLKENLLSGACLMFLPLAARSRDWLLLTGLLVLMLWSRGVAAWLGLAAALVAHRRHQGGFLYKAGAAIGVVCLVALYAQAQSPEVLNRLAWWGAAIGVFWERPLLGSGPGTFAVVSPAHAAAGGLGSVYAHQAVLETLAESGAPYALLWYLGLAHSLRNGGRGKAFGALALLVQSMWDYTLSIPGLYWLLCYYAGCGLPECSRGFDVSSRLKLPAAVAVLGLGWVLCGRLWDGWEADRLRARAAEAISLGQPASRALAMLRRAAELEAHPDDGRLAAQAYLRGAQASAAEALSASERLEEAARADPYRASTWLSLERLYVGLGLTDLAAESRGRGAVHCPPLRGARR